MPKSKLQRKREKEAAKQDEAFKQEEESKFSDLGSDSEDPYGEETDAKKDYSKVDRSRDLERIRLTEDMYELIELSKVVDPYVKLKAIQQMCPCRVKSDIPEFWHRIFELAEDPDSKVRYQVMHNMCDGSPAEYEDTVIEIIEILARDRDYTIRSKAQKILTSYNRTGKYNIM